jgi:hypothetical protein
VSTEDGCSQGSGFGGRFLVVDVIAVEDEEEEVLLEVESGGCHQRGDVVGSCVPEVNSSIY